MSYWDDIIAESKAVAAQRSAAATTESKGLTTETAQRSGPPLVSNTIEGPGGTITLDNSGGFTYIGGDGQRYWDSYAPETQDRLIGQMVDAGLIPEGTSSRDRYSLGSAWEYVLGAANEWSVTPFNALARIQIDTRDSGGGGGGGGGAAPRVEIPDYPTIAQNAKSMLRQIMGRDVQDWEVAMTGAEMQRQYQKWAETKQSAALGGGGIYEINDPNTMTQAFIEDEYASELDRIKGVDEQQTNYNLVMQSLTKGAGMVGG